MAFKRMFFDLETSPNLVLSWNVGYKLRIDYDNIVKEREIICICWKWEGEEKVNSLHWDKSQSDKSMLEKFIKQANQADEIVGHNGDRFDLPWLKTRCLFHRIPTFPEYTTVDTLKLAKKFRFNSNRLDYIAKFLGVGAKMDTGGFGLWKAIVREKCGASLKKMVEYCEQDVRVLELVYNEIRPHVKHKTHQGVFHGQDKASCVHCASPLTKVHQTHVTAAGVIMKKMRCKSCGTFFRISESTYLKAIAERKMNEALKAKAEAE